MTNRPFHQPKRLPAEAYTRAESAFHVVVRAMPGTTPFVGPVGDGVWVMAAEERARDAVQLIAACLMPDHFHAVVRPSRQAIVPWVNSFKSITTRASWRAGWRGGIWQPSFYDRRIRDSEFSETLAYVVMNPVVAGLAEEWVAWPWVWVEPGS